MTIIEVSTGALALIGVVGTIIGVQRHNSASRTRIYERFDEDKDRVDVKMRKEYARKDMCQLRHEQVDKKLDKIEAQTACLPEMAAQLKLLANKE